MKKPILIFLLAALWWVGTQAQAQNKKNKRQEIVFEGSEVDGQGRNPDGSYLVQKRGVDFEPLYEVKKALKNNIKESVEYLR